MKKALIVIVTFAFIFAVNNFFVTEEGSVPAYNNASPKVKIILDAGHGGLTNTTD